MANHGHPDYPELEDYGHANLIADNGATNHFRVDWFTPDGLRAWGDGRTIILGTEGFIELRKYTDITRDAGGDHLFLVNGTVEKHFALHGKVGFPFFGAGDSRLPEPDGKSDDAGPRLQGGGALFARAGAGTADCGAFAVRTELRFLRASRVRATK